MRYLLIAWLFLAPAVLAAAPSGVVRFATGQPLEAVYDRLYKAFEADKFWVVLEADMGKRMARFADKWGEDYNRNGLGAVKSMVFCNIWWTNRIANADPDLLGLCPLHVSLYEKDGQTVLVMPRPSVMAEGSPGRERAAELEEELTGIVRGVLASE